MWCKSLEVMNPYEALKEADMHDLKLRECPFCGGNAEEAFLKRKKLFASMRCFDGQGNGLQIQA